MVQRLLMAVSARLPAREITRANGAPYLERYYLGSLFGWTFYLHRFLAGDDGAHLHDHPWRLSWSLLLAGRYIETRLKSIDGDGVHLRQRWLRFGRLNIIRGTDFHRIDLRDSREVWTLFAHGRRCRQWGFLKWLWWSDSSLVVEYRAHPAKRDEELRWHTTAPTGAELREQQRQRTAAHPGDHAA